MDDGVSPAALLAMVRGICLKLPETNERLSHGQPGFFIREKRAFATFADNHHDDGRLAIWCAAPAGMQAALVASAPEQYFIPPYVGHLGWIGLRLDRGLEREAIDAALHAAYRERAPAALLKTFPND